MVRAAHHARSRTDQRRRRPHRRGPVGARGRRTVRLLTQRCGLIPRIWVLPADLPRVKIGAHLSARRRAAILAATAQAVEPRGRNAARRSILERIFAVLGKDAEIVHVVAALDCSPSPTTATPPTIRPTSCSPGENAKNSAPRSPTSRRLAVRAAALPRALLPSKDWGSGEREPYAQVKIIATGAAPESSPERRLRNLHRRSAEHPTGPAGGPRQGPGRPWARMIILCGADALPEWAVRRLSDAAARLATGVVLLYRRASENALAQLRADGNPPRGHAPTGRCSSRGRRSLPRRRPRGADPPPHRDRRHCSGRRHCRRVHHRCLLPGHRGRTGPLRREVRRAADPGPAHPLPPRPGGTPPGKPPTRTPCRPSGPRTG